VKVWEVKRLEGGIMERRVIRWMGEETSEAMKELFWTVENQLSHGVSVHIVFKSVVNMITNNIIL
jgi:hypothetical protein